MRRLTTIAGIRAAVAAERAAGRRIGLVPTMGALHDGHLSLVEACHRHADVVVVSIFVNPTQFGPGEDLAAYPRDLTGDEARLAALGGHAPAYVFAPEVDEVYPRPGLTTVVVHELTDVLCGVSRPTHFDGVTTVVTKLFNIVAPDVAVFGRKDFQQLAVLRRMVADLDLPVEVVGAPLVREADGVAMSSRNRYLDDADRAAARVLSRALVAAVLAAREARGHGRAPSAEVLRGVAAATLAAEPRVRTDYVEVLDPESLTPPDTDAEAVPGRAPGPGGGGADRAPGTRPAGPAAPARLLVAVAAHVGPARLIDNVVVGDEADEDRLLAATHDRP
jgi:pantoate--beta-alanine ligase